MITDDPFTPENGHRGNNIALQFTETASSKEIDIPAVDINYGYGDHIQLKIEMPVNMSYSPSNTARIFRNASSGL